MRIVQECILQLEQDKKDLVSELNAVNRNTVSTTLFANLKSQQDYNNSLTIMEKIVHLKRLTKTIDKEQVDDFAWLQPQSKRPILDGSQLCSQLVQELAIIGFEC